MGLEMIAKNPKHEKLEMCRRGFFKVLLAGGSVTAAGTLAGHVLIKSERKPTEQLNRNKIAKSKGISVFDYATEIIDAAYGIGNESIYDFQELSFYGYIIGGVTSIASTFHLDWGKTRTFLTLTATGGLGALVGKLVDLHSVHYPAKVMQDKRFVEYGIDAAFKQQTMGYIKYFSENREWTDLKVARRDAIRIALGAILYPLGHGTAVSSIFTYEHNMRIARLLQLSYRIGDGVKGMIERGYNDAGIRSYLNTLTAADLGK